jgi:hypothetical protein
MFVLENPAHPLLSQIGPARRAAAAT